MLIVGQAQLDGWRTLSRLDAFVSSPGARSDPQANLQGLDSDGSILHRTSSYIAYHKRRTQGYMTNKHAAQTN